MSILVDRKNGYNTEIKNDFTLPGELMVTITLSEYRELVRCKATRDAAIEKEDNDRVKRYVENKNLKKENEKLKEKLLKYVTEETQDNEEVNNYGKD